ncbi:hypothetical protein ACT3SP_04440 [Brachybacterium sp. AOP43-C2-M15]|uniref:hypothetical protein n=1 Tax=Brachybacterium sp. AOP43-C2-M15 TaxID=3457661 RepID=UPI0040337B10
MSSFLGADTDALRDLAQLYEAGASSLEETAGPSLHRALGVTWVGPDADEFRSTCQQLRARLDEVHEAIFGWADCFVAQADQQDSASEGESGASAGGHVAQTDLTDILKDFPFSSGGGKSWKLPEFFPRFSPHDWVPPLLKEGADAVADKVEKSLPKAERFLKKVTPVIPDAYDAGRHYLNGETAEGNFAVMRGMVSAIPYVGVGVDLADLASSGHPEGSGLERLEKWYVDGMNDPDSAMSKGEREGLRKADEQGIENKYARNIIKVAVGNGRAWEESNLHRDENGDVNPWMT